ncbi:Zn-dependent hydrolase [Sinanaerobacter sp. ZZT-01]|uniref:Zn-dependent hydrolase n=1 Tax=Sinanaerobacter sp. ZZT-01 TaxID=3111540 RepID=UPI002D795D24|nr:Zn-dependent hydrolase [Sinanaerobacter sp. ZZT-01]WRR93238.1 Zn-dependent hydrolase [Sinanaerobacter sp. ZZT-01]
MKVNGERLLCQIQELGKIGFKEGSGTTRISYSKEYEMGRDYVKKKMQEAGLQVSVDAVGNLCGLRKGYGKKILVGSHIDTVPSGGIYDGVYGVMAAIECLKVMEEEQYSNHHPIEVIAFIEEEGNVIGGTFGSKAFAGGVIDRAMLPKMHEHKITMEQVLSCKRSREEYACYLELHIEQGGRLEAEEKEIGIVGGIVGILRYQATVEGKSNHAGSTPMELRRDALVKSCEIITELMKSVRSNSPEMVCTVGQMNVFPGVVNVIPGKVEFIIELRNKNMEPMKKIISDLLKKYREDGFSVSEFIHQPETLCDARLLNIVRKSADELGVSHKEMFSGAGHDLINMGLFTPSALIFIPSQNGISHSIEEYSSPENLIKGADLLLHLLLKLDQKEDVNED